MNISLGTILVRINGGDESIPFDVNGNDKLVLIPSLGWETVSPIDEISSYTQTEIGGITYLMFSAIVTGIHQNETSISFQFYSGYYQDYITSYTMYTITLGANTSVNEDQIVEENAWTSNMSQYTTIPNLADLTSNAQLNAALDFQADVLIEGCTDEAACNFDSEAEFDDGLCEYPAFECWCYDENPTSCPAVCGSDECPDDNYPPYNQSLVPQSGSEYVYFGDSVSLVLTFYDDDGSLLDNPAEFLCSLEYSAPWTDGYTPFTSGEYSDIVVVEGTPTKYQVTFDDVIPPNMPVWEYDDPSFGVTYNAIIKHHPAGNEAPYERYQNVEASTSITYTAQNIAPEVPTFAPEWMQDTSVSQIMDENSDFYLHYPVVPGYSFTLVASSVDVNDDDLTYSFSVEGDNPPCTLTTTELSNKVTVSISNPDVTSWIENVPVAVCNIYAEASDEEELTGEPGIFRLVVYYDAPPILNNLPMNINSNEDESYQTNLLASSIEGHSVYFQIDNIYDDFNNDVEMTEIAISNGTEFSFTPPLNWNSDINGMIYVDVTAIEGPIPGYPDDYWYGNNYPHSAGDTITIDVSPMSDFTQFTQPESPQTMLESQYVGDSNAHYTINLSEYAFDPDNPVGTDLTYYFESIEGDTGSTIGENWNLDANSGVLTYDPPPYFNGTISISITVIREEGTAGHTEYTGALNFDLNVTSVPSNPIAIMNHQTGAVFKSGEQIDFTASESYSPDNGIGIIQWIWSLEMIGPPYSDIDVTDIYLDFPGENTAYPAYNNENMSFNLPVVDVDSQSSDNGAMKICLSVYDERLLGANTCSTIIIESNQIPIINQFTAEIVENNRIKFNINAYDPDGWTDQAHAGYLQLVGVEPEEYSWFAGQLNTFETLIPGEGNTIEVFTESIPEDILFNYNFDYNLFQLLVCDTSFDQGLGFGEIWHADNTLCATFDITVEIIPGCMDIESTTYDPLANMNDGTCQYIPDQISVSPAFQVSRVNEEVALNIVQIVDSDFNGENTYWPHPENPYKYHYTWGDGSAKEIITNPMETYNTHTYTELSETADGKYHVEVCVEDTDTPFLEFPENATCETVEIVVSNQVPIAEFTLSEPSSTIEFNYLANEIITITDASVDTNQSDSITTWNWNLADAETVGGSPIEGPNPYTGPFDIKFSTVGTRTISLHVIDSFGYYSDSYEVILNIGQGCTNPAACNYNSLIEVEAPGSCEYAQLWYYVPTYVSMEYCNYNCAELTLNGAENCTSVPILSCLSPGNAWVSDVQGYTLTDIGNCWCDEGWDDCGVCDGDNFDGCSGCTDPAADNYNPDVLYDDASCTYPQDTVIIYGCTDNTIGQNYDINGDTTCGDTGDSTCNACNYNPAATHDNGTCAYNDGCGCYEAPPLVCCTDLDEDGLCDTPLQLTSLDFSGDYMCGYSCQSYAYRENPNVGQERWGCTDPIAPNFNHLATNDDGSCEYTPGCIDILALNFNTLANVDCSSNESNWNLSYTECTQDNGCDTSCCNYVSENSIIIDPVTSLGISQDTYNIKVRGRDYDYTFQTHFGPDAVVNKWGDWTQWDNTYNYGGFVNSAVDRGDDRSLQLDDIIFTMYYFNKDIDPVNPYKGYLHNKMSHIGENEYLPMSINPFNGMRRSPHYFQESQEGDATQSYWADPGDFTTWQWWGFPQHNAYLGGKNQYGKIFHPLFTSEIYSWDNDITYYAHNNGTTGQSFLGLSPAQLGIQGWQQFGFPDPSTDGWEYQKAPSSDLTEVYTGDWLEDLSYCVWYGTYWDFDTPGGWYDIDDVDQICQAIYIDSYELTNNWMWDVAPWYPPFRYDLYWASEYMGPDPNQDIFAGVVFYADKNYYTEQSLASWKEPSSAQDTHVSNCITHPFNPKFIHQTDAGGSNSSQFDNITEVPMQHHNTELTNHSYTCPNLGESRIDRGHIVIENAPIYAMVTKDPGNPEVSDFQPWTYTGTIQENTGASIHGCEGTDWQNPLTGGTCLGEVDMKALYRCNTGFAGTQCKNLGFNSDDKVFDFNSYSEECSNWDPNSDSDICITNNEFKSRVAESQIGTWSASIPISGLFGIISPGKGTYEYTQEASSVGGLENFDETTTLHINDGWPADFVPRGCNTEPGGAINWSFGDLYQEDADVFEGYCYDGNIVPNLNPLHGIGNALTSQQGWLGPEAPTSNQIADLPVINPNTFGTTFFWPPDSDYNPHRGVSETDDGAVWKQYGLQMNGIPTYGFNDGNSFGFITWDGWFRGPYCTSYSDVLDWAINDIDIVSAYYRWITMGQSSINDPEGSQYSRGDYMYDAMQIFSPPCTGDATNAFNGSGQCSFANMPFSQTGQNPIIQHLYYQENADLHPPAWWPLGDPDGWSHIVSYTSMFDEDGYAPYWGTDCTTCAFQDGGNYPYTWKPEKGLREVYPLSTTLAKNLSETGNQVIPNGTTIAPIIEINIDCTAYGHPGDCHPAGIPDGLYKERLQFAPYANTKNIVRNTIRSQENLTTGAMPAGGYNYNNYEIPSKTGGRERFMDPVSIRSDEEYSAGGDGQVYRWIGTMADWMQNLPGPSNGHVDKTNDMKDIAEAFYNYDDTALGDYIGPEDNAFSEEGWNGGQHGGFGSTELWSNQYVGRYKFIKQRYDKLFDNPYRLPIIKYRLVIKDLTAQSEGSDSFILEDRHINYQVSGIDISNFIYNGINFKFKNEQSFHKIEINVTAYDSENNEVENVAKILDLGRIIEIKQSVSEFYNPYQGWDITPPDEYESISTVHQDIMNPDNCIPELQSSYSCSSYYLAADSSIDFTETGEYGCCHVCNAAWSPGDCQESCVIYCDTLGQEYVSDNCDMEVGVCDCMCQTVDYDIGKLDDEKYIDKHDKDKRPNLGTWTYVPPNTDLKNWETIASGRLSAMSDSGNFTGSISLADGNIGNVLKNSEFKLHPWSEVHNDGGYYGAKGYAGGGAQSAQFVEPAGAGWDDGSDFQNDRSWNLTVPTNMDHFAYPNSPNRYGTYHNDAVRVDDWSFGPATSGWPGGDMSSIYGRYTKNVSSNNTQCRCNSPILGSVCGGIDGTENNFNEYNTGYFARHAKFVRNGHDVTGYDECLSGTCMKMVDYVDRNHCIHGFKGISQTIASGDIDLRDQLGWDVGDKITISWWQKTNNIKKPGAAGIYHAQKRTWYRESTDEYMTHRSFEGCNHTIPECQLNEKYCPTGNFNDNSCGYNPEGISLGQKYNTRENEWQLQSYTFEIDESWVLFPQWVINSDDTLEWVNPHVAIFFYGNGPLHPRSNWSSIVWSNLDSGEWAPDSGPGQGGMYYPQNGLEDPSDEDDFAGIIWYDKPYVGKRLDAGVTTFWPDVDVRTERAYNNSQANLYTYYDPDINPVEYNDSTGPGQVNVYIYPREDDYCPCEPGLHSDLGGYPADIYGGSLNCFNDACYGNRTWKPRETQDDLFYKTFSPFYVWNIDWGDGTKDYETQALNISNNTYLTHSYDQPGFYEISAWMFSVVYDVRDRETSRGVYDYKKFVTRIFLPESSDSTNEFDILGGRGFAYMPYKKTSPVISGVTNQSIYFKSLYRNLGFNEDAMKIFEPYFLKYWDRLKAEMALAQVDERFKTEAIDTFSQIYTKHKGSWDAYLAGECVECSEYGIFSECANNMDSGCSWDTEEEISGGIPCVCSDPSAGCCVGYDDVIFDSIFTEFEELGDYLGEVDIAQVRYFDKPIPMYRFLGFECDINTLDGNMLPNSLIHMDTDYLEHDGSGTEDDIDNTGYSIYHVPQGSSVNGVATKNWDYYGIGNNESITFSGEFKVDEIKANPCSYFNDTSYCGRPNPYFRGSQDKIGPEGNWAYTGYAQSCSPSDFGPLFGYANKIDEIGWDADGGSSDCMWETYQYTPSDAMPVGTKFHGWLVGPGSAGDVPHPIYGLDVPSVGGGYLRHRPWIGLDKQHCQADPKCHWNAEFDWSDYSPEAAAVHNLAIGRCESACGAYNNGDWIDAWTGEARSHPIGVPKSPNSIQCRRELDMGYCTNAGNSNTTNHEAYELTCMKFNNPDDCLNGPHQGVPKASCPNGECADPETLQGQYLSVNCQWIPSEDLPMGTYTGGSTDQCVVDTADYEEDYYGEGQVPGVRSYIYTASETDGWIRSKSVVTNSTEWTPFEITMERDDTYDTTVANNKGDCVFCYNPDPDGSCWDEYWNGDAVILAENQCDDVNTCSSLGHGNTWCARGFNIRPRFAAYHWPSNASLYEFGEGDNGLPLIIDAVGDTYETYPWVTEGKSYLRNLQINRGESAIPFMYNAEEYRIAECAQAESGIPNNPRYWRNILPADDNIALSRKDVYPQIESFENVYVVEWSGEESATFFSPFFNKIYRIENTNTFSIYNFNTTNLALKEETLTSVTGGHELNLPVTPEDEKIFYVLVFQSLAYNSEVDIVFADWPSGPPIIFKETGEQIVLNNGFIQFSESSLIFVDENSSQTYEDINEYGINYYYPVLPKLDRYLQFNESLGLQGTESIIETADEFGETQLSFTDQNIPYGGPGRKWDADDIYSWSTKSFIQSGEVLIDINFSALDAGGVLNDNASLNKNILISDYTLNFTPDTNEPIRKGFVDNPEINDEKRAY